MLLGHKTIEYEAIRDGHNADLEPNSQGYVSWRALWHAVREGGLVLKDDEVGGRESLSSCRGRRLWAAGRVGYCRVVRCASRCTSRPLEWRPPLHPRCPPCSDLPRSGPPASQLRHYAWLRDAYLLSSRGRFRVTARMVRQPRRKVVQLSCFATLTKDSLSSALVSGTFLWKDPDSPVGAGWGWVQGGVGRGWWWLASVAAKLPGWEQLASGDVAVLPLHLLPCSPYYVRAGGGAAGIS